MTLDLTVAAEHTATSSRVSRRTTTLSAYELHEATLPTHAHASSCDLLFLRQDVQLSIRRSEIRPPPDGRDEFQSFDCIYGPSIYTVNEQYIKPVTSKAGKMSWALMKNPEGLECHLFISHAWQEGVFEFLTKVRHSWPRAALHAWCCMLANPQNLNIALFLTSPSTSPFALALKASEMVLVVPNRHQSVYTRLWCAYEAYLAQEEGKRILVAKSSHRHEICRSLQLLALASVLGVLLGLAGGLDEMGFHELVQADEFVSRKDTHDTTRIVLHFLCVMIFWTQVSHYEPWFPAWSQTYHFAPAAHFVFHLTFYLILGNSWSLLWGKNWHVLEGTTSASILAERFENGKLTLGTDLVIDAAAVFDHIAAHEAKVPHDASMTIHSLKARELLSDGKLQRMIWCDTRSMLADGLNKGTIDRAALQCAVSQGRWTIDQPVRIHGLQTPKAETAASFCYLCEVDRINGRSTVLESNLLQKGYSGSIRLRKEELGEELGAGPGEIGVSLFLVFTGHAQCSEPADAAKIEAEIGEKVLHVDYAIHVLLTAGMSSPALREIAGAGVEIEYAAYSETHRSNGWQVTGCMDSSLLLSVPPKEISCPVICLGPCDLCMTGFLLLELLDYRGTRFLVSMLLSACSVLLRLALICVICWRSTDERCFILKVMTKMVALLMLVVFGMALVCFVADLVTPQKLTLIWLSLSTITFAATLAFALLGIQGTAKLPCGLILLQIFFARGTKTLAACGWRARTPTGARPFVAAVPHADDSEVSDGPSETSSSS
ncbi:unnamed protein product [Durusdinium trenchii]|uniref:Uncharacterized protein n=1 Tax=Durusdinium trenchii TaxID=1381693 RepID=A0ABP0HCC8_9DINO